MVHVLAHQGGWDEILLVVAPLLLFALLLAGARRRVGDIDHGDDRESADSLDGVTPTTDGSSPGGGS